MISLTARYYDGVVSNAVNVTIELDDTDRVRIAGLPEPLEYPLSHLRIDPPLGSTTRTIVLPGGASCESDDHAALDELLRRSGRGKGGAFVHLLESTWRAALFAALLLLGLIAGGIRWGIPFTAKQVAYAIPTEMAFDLGRGTLAMLDETVLDPTELSPERQATLRSGFTRIAEGYHELPLQLNFRRGPGPNAFVLPNGAVIVTDELVELAKDDNEIFSVLAHEIGHVHYRHALRAALESSTVLILFSAYLGDVTQLSTLSGALPGIVAQSHYSREHEYEADGFARDYLDQHHIPRRHFANILRSLQAVGGPEPDESMNYLASHPPTSERIKRFE